MASASVEYRLSSVYSLNSPPFPLIPTPANLSPHLNLPIEDLTPLLRFALLHALAHGSIDLIQFLIKFSKEHKDLPHGMGVPWDIKDEEDGWGVVGMSLMGSSGREEKEEVVRAVVKFVDVKETDNGGWTPLHLAALLSTPPLISFLLNSGADPHAKNKKGLTPLDLIIDLSSRSAIAQLLTSVMIPPTPPIGVLKSPSMFSNGPTLQPPPPPIPIPSLNRQREAQKKEMQSHQITEKENWIREICKVAGIDEALLLEGFRLDEEDRDADEEESEKKARRRISDASEDSSVVQKDAIDPHEPPPYDTLLVFSLPNLPHLLQTLVSSYNPVCFPRASRNAPANALYLCCRFALYHCDDLWLEELMVGIVDRVERGVYENVDNVAFLAFWESNMCLLLHLIKSDSGLEGVCEELDLLGILEQLINAIHVYVIRIVERRIDEVLDAALLDYETMEEFEDVKFEGDWNFFKSLTGKKAKKRAPMPVTPAAGNRASMDFALLERSTSSTSGPSNLNTISSGGIPPSPSSRLRNAHSIDDIRPYRNSADGFNSPSTSAIPSVSEQLNTDTSPKTITAFLSSILVVLQLYEVNPAIIIQTFSQVYFWIGCETFNRILTRRKYLCRSKAIQIKMNMTTLEDWIRENQLPSRTATKHLEPVNQLLQWLQTCSSLREFDHLVVIISNLRSLNPLQMQRAMKDYSYEVNEGKMSHECAQYLAQLQKDWEKRRVRIGVEAIQRDISEKEKARLDRYRGDSSAATHSKAPSETPPYNPALLEPETYIDSLFNPDIMLGDYNPPSAPECLGELLDCRFMLPFSLPQDIDLLVATPPAGAAFSHLLRSSPRPPTQFESPFLPARPSSRNSFSSLRALSYSRQPRNSVKDLPDWFLSWLEAEEAKVEKFRPRQESVAMAMGYSSEESKDGGGRQSLGGGGTELRRTSGAVLLPSQQALGVNYVERPTTFEPSSLSNDGNSSGDDFSPAMAAGISSHGRKSSNTTIKGRPSRLETIMPGDRPSSSHQSTITDEFVDTPAASPDKSSSWRNYNSHQEYSEDLTPTAVTVHETFDA